MNQFERVVNTPVVVLGTLNSTSGAVTAVIYKDGALNNTSVTASRLDSNGLVSFSFTPTVSGVYYVYAENTLVSCVEVVSKSVRTYLQNIEDEALGSWTWDKNTGALQLLRQDGTVLGNYSVIDSLDNSSRERL